MVQPLDSPGPASVAVLKMPSPGSRNAGDSETELDIGVNGEVVVDAADALNDDSVLPNTDFKSWATNDASSASFVDWHCADYESDTGARPRKQSRLGDTGGGTARTRSERSSLDRHAPSRS